MAIVTTIALGLLAAAATLALVRVIRPGSIADRIVGLDTMLVVLVGAIAVGAARRGEGIYLDVLVVTALLGFVGTVVVARFIERRGT